MNELLLTLKQIEGIMEPKSFFKTFTMRPFYIPFLRFFLGLTCLCYSSSCTLHHLNVQTQYLSHENLASYYTGTPDPRLNDPVIGQRLLIQWMLRSCEMENPPLFLHLVVRLRNHQEKTINVPIEAKRGYYVYDLTNQDFCQSGGILTYYVEIRDASCVIATWKHPLWADLITFDYSKEESASNSQQ